MMTSTKAPSQVLGPARKNNHSTSSITMRRSFAKWIPPIFVVLPLFLLFSTTLPDQSITVNLGNSAAFTPYINIRDPSSFTPAQQRLLQYAQWHEQQRICLTNSSCTNPPLFIWQCLEDNPMRCAGVGDRFRGLAFSLLLAVATKRVLLVDWPSFPYPLEHAIIPAFFNWTVPNSLKSNTFPIMNWFNCVPGRPCYTPYSPSINHLPPPNVTNPERDFNLQKDDIKKRLSKYPYITLWNRIDLTNLRYFQQNPHLVSLLPEFQEMDLVDLQRSLNAFLFSPSPSLENMLRSVALNISEGYDGLHVRTGGDVGETKHERFQKLNEDMSATVKEVLSCVKKKQAEEKRQVFLASDSTQFKELFKKRAIEDGIDVLYLEQRAIHFGLSQGLTQQMKEKDRRLSFFAVFADLLLLGGAESIMFTGSGFAKVAFGFGNASRLIDMKEKCPL